MGEAFLVQKNKRFKNKQEQSYAAQLSSPDLLSAISDHQTTLYRFQPLKNALPTGTKLVLLDEGFELVSVLAGLVAVGSIDAIGTADLRALFAKFPVLQKSVTASIAGEIDWAGYQSVSLESIRTNP